MFGVSAIAFIVTFLLFSVSGMLFRLDRNWYNTLVKPKWTPSGAVIGLIWIVLYGCISLATAIVVDALPVWQWPYGLIVLFLTNWFFNQTFTYWMFAKKNLYAAYLTALLTFSTACLLMVGYGDIVWLAGLLLIPYVLWTAIASYLAWSIYGANKRSKV